MYLDYQWYEIALLVAAGVAAGVVNTLAGSGTVFTFGAMLFFDIPITLANTTNRVGVFFQNIFGIASFMRYGSYSIPFKKLLKYLIPSLVGAALGAVMAVNSSQLLLDIVAGVVMGLLALDMIFNLSRRFLLKSGDSKTQEWVKPVVLLVIGFYGGYIQIGIGLLLLAFLFKFDTESLNEANLLKLLIVLAYTVPTTIYFIAIGQILWAPALLLSAGQMVGAFAAGFFAHASSSADKYIKGLLLMMTLVTLLKILFF
jgi:uncharacterized membrane protein YfcA